MISKNTFYIWTVIKWRKAFFTPKREPDFISGEGEAQSLYWYTPKGVFRQSRHWGRNIAHCWWPIEDFEKSFKTSCAFLDAPVTGFAPWASFKRSRELTVQKIHELRKNAAQKGKAVIKRKNDDILSKWLLIQEEDEVKLLTYK